MTAWREVGRDTPRLRLDLPRALMRGTGRRCASLVRRPADRADEIWPAAPAVRVARDRRTRQSGRAMVRRPVFFHPSGLEPADRGGGRPVRPDPLRVGGRLLPRTEYPPRLDGWPGPGVSGPLNRRF